MLETISKFSCAVTSDLIWSLSYCVTPQKSFDGSHDDGCRKSCVWDLKYGVIVFHFTLQSALQFFGVHKISTFLCIYSIDRKAVGGTRDKTLTNPNAPAWMKVFAEGLPDDDTEASSVTLKESARHHKIRVFKNSTIGYNRWVNKTKKIWHRCSSGPDILNMLLNSFAGSRLKCTSMRRRECGLRWAPARLISF